VKGKKKKVNAPGTVDDGRGVVFTKKRRRNRQGLIKRGALLSFDHVREVRKNKVVGATFVKGRRETKGGQQLKGKDWRKTGQAWQGVKKKRGSTKRIWLRR